MGGSCLRVLPSPPLSLLFSIPFSFPLRSRQLLDLMPISRLLLPFPPPSVSILGAASHPSLISATFPLALYTRSGRQAGGRGRVLGAGKIQ